MQNQLSAPSAEVTRPERVRPSSSEEANISSQMDQRREELSVPATGIEPAPLNMEVRTQRNDVEINEEIEDDVSPPQVSGSVRPSLNVDDLVPSQNVHQQTGNISDTSRGSHVRSQNVNVQHILGISPGERSISSDDR